METAAIHLLHLYKSFHGLSVLQDFSATLEQGRVYGLMGPSGAGKTTLLRILMGLEKTDSGQILGLEGKRLSAVFQEDRLCEAFTPLENVLMAADQSLGRKRIREELCRLLPEESIDRPVFTLSGGMKRRTAVCRALLAPFDVLLLDEPFTGLDEAAKQVVISRIQSFIQGKLVVLSTHQAEDLIPFGALLLQISI